MEQKKLGLPSVVATGVGLIVATSCLLSIGQGTAAIGLPFIITMAIACAFNILTAFSISSYEMLAYSSHVRIVISAPFLRHSYSGRSTELCSSTVVMT